MPELHERLKDELKRNGTRMLDGPHLTAFLEDWWRGRTREVAEMAARRQETERPKAPARRAA
jgi:hypothetical protein